MNVARAIAHQLFPRVPVSVRRRHTQKPVAHQTTRTHLIFPAQATRYGLERNSTSREGAARQLEDGSNSPNQSLNDCSRQ